MDRARRLELFEHGMNYKEAAVLDACDFREEGGTFDTKGDWDVECFKDRVKQFGLAGLSEDDLWAIYLEAFNAELGHR